MGKKRDSGSCLPSSKTGRSTFSSSLCTKNLRNNKEKGKKGRRRRKGEETKGVEKKRLAVERRSSYNVTF